MSDHPQYERIAMRFAFELPEEYRRLHNRGWLTLDRPASAISATPGDGYLYMNEMEWVSLEKIASFEFSEYYHPHLPGLVPFAFNGGGYYWCWQSDKTDHRGTPVLLCYHDSCSAVVFAPNFQAALFRQALIYAHCWIGGVGHPVVEGRAFLHRWAHDLAVIFPPAWCDVLSELSSRALVNWSDSLGSHTTLLSPDELKRLEERELQFTEMGSEFPWADLPVEPFGD